MDKPEPDHNLAERIARLSPAKRALLEQQLQERRIITWDRIPTRPPGADCPLSYSQERVWFLSHLEPDNYSFNRPVAVAVDGPLDVEALQRSVNAIIQRHEVLRTSYPSADGQPRQVSASEMVLSLPVVDLTGEPPAQRSSTLERLIQQDIERPFDLEHGPIVRCTLFRLGSTEHVLFFNVHHIAFDGWSTGVLFDDLGAFYAAFTTGSEPDLEPLPVQYPDYAHWQRQDAQHGRLEELLVYWKQQLAGRLPAFQFPTDRLRPALQTHVGRSLHLELPEALAEPLADLSKASGVTLFTTLLAAFKVLLYRYSGQEDILVGTPTANRGRVEVEKLIGFFVNTLILRTAFSGSMTFEELLRAVNQTVLGAVGHHDLPFEMLVAELQPERDLSRPPLFQVMFNFENMPRTRKVSTQGITFSEYAFQSGTSLLDLDVEITREDGGLRCVFTYNRDLFDESTILSMMGHYRMLLESVVQNPATPVAELNLLTPQERHRVLVEWNDTAAPYPQQTVVELFEAQAERIPDAPAFYFEDNVLTYRELNRQANQLAHHLRQMGVEPEQVVGVHLERSFEAMIGLLGVLKAGGVFLPLDPAYPPDRIAFMLEDSEARVVVTTEALSAALRAPTVQAVCLDRDRQALEAGSEENPQTSLTPDSLLYVIYTSGSTGVPKGVAVPHRQLVISAFWLWEAYPFTEQDINCQRAAFSFQDAIWETFVPLLGGSPTAIIPDSAAEDVRLLVAELARHRVTRIIVLPSLLKLMLDLFPDLGERLPDLTFWVTSSEPLTRDLLTRFCNQVPHASLYNLYGTSEISDVTWYEPDPRYADLPRFPIGRPIPNLRVYLLDENLQPVPVGVPGEIVVGSPGMSRGYLNHPDLTAQKYIHSPFDDSLETPLYRTGDLARYLPDGVIDYLGRADQQVQINGIRIELSEIEEILRQHPGVDEAVVDARADPFGDQRLVAYVMGSSLPEQLMEHLLPRLPKFMIPALFVHLDRLPYTPSGKVDRQVLPDPDWSQRLLADEPVLPRSKTEARLVEIWREMMGVDRVGIRDDFFDLGGHSLMAARLMARIEREFGQVLPLAMLFQEATIEHLAKALEQGRRSAAWSPLVPIQPRGHRPPFFCVHGIKGNVVHMRPLARELGLDQPFYGVQPRGLDGVEQPYTRIEDMAAYYIDALRTVQPTGPYYIGGYSYGGFIAYEMARQLTAQGEQVGMVVLFDTRLIKKPHRPLRRHEVVRSRLRVVGRDLRARARYFNSLKSPAQKLSYLRYQFTEILKGRFLIRQAMRARRQVSPYSAIVERANRQALADYVAQPYSGRITYLLASLNLDQSVRPVNRRHEMWAGLAQGGIDVINVPGSHGTMMAPPNVKTLARALKARLVETQDRGPERHNHEVQTGTATGWGQQQGSN